MDQLLMTVMETALIATAIAVALSFLWAWTETRVHRWWWSTDLCWRLNRPCDGPRERPARWTPRSRLPKEQPHDRP